MKNIEKEEIIEFIEKKSRFIGYIKPVNSVEEANKYIDKIRNEHKDATHNVPVYRVIENAQEYFKYNDDGEPQGTAGKPMADILERRDIYNVAMVAVRYFGGIKLGAGGLIRNYARVSKELIDQCNLITYVEKRKIIISFDYAKKGLIDKYIKDNNIEVLEQSFLDRINMKILIPKDSMDIFKSLKDVEIIDV